MWSNKSDSVWESTRVMQKKKKIDNWERERDRNDDSLGSDRENS